MKYLAPALLSAATVVSARGVPPGIPSASAARSLLEGLTVSPWTNTDSYDRDLFPHWSTVEGSCSGREYVLRRDGDNVQTGSDCYPTSGSWTSPFDGATWTDPQDIDIDHMVPLANAWRSGAARWSTSQREDFANDIGGPQLWAVTDNVNQEKSDRGPEDWLPPLTSFYCTYAAAWTQVKSDWDLTITSAEYAALDDILSGC